MSPPQSATHPHDPVPGSLRVMSLRLISLAWRNLWRNRRRTLITVSTIAVGFALGVFSIGLGDGGHNQMIRNAINMGDGHLTIQPAGYLATPSNQSYLPDGEGLSTLPPFVPAEADIAPRIFLQVLVATAYNSIGAGLQGVDMAADPLGTMMRPKLVEGAWPVPEDRLGVVIGRKMAEKLKARVGSKLVIMAGGEDGTVESRLGRVRGIFRSGLSQLDGFLVLSGLGFARPLLPGYNADRDGAAVTRLAVFLSTPDDQEPLKQALIDLPLPAPAVVLDWEEMMPQVVNFVIVDDFFNYIWMVFVLAMVAFGIINTILMSTLERTREFGLLQALGMKSRHMFVLVLCETVLLAGVALAMGWLLGGSLHAYFAIEGMDFSGLYPDGVETAGMFMEPILYPELSAGRVWALTVIVFITTLASGIYPAIKAARITPMAALRT